MVLITKSIIAALAALSFTSALPTEEMDTIEKRGAMDPNTSQCSAHGWTNSLGSPQFPFSYCTTWATYTVRIGVPFNKGAGCTAVRDAINAAVKSDGAKEGIDLPTFRCQYDEASMPTDQTSISFGACWNHAQAINTGLKEVYPMVNIFTCPNN